MREGGMPVVPDRVTLHNLPTPTSTPGGYSPSVLEERGARPRNKSPGIMFSHCSSRSLEQRVWTRQWISGQQGDADGSPTPGPWTTLNRNHSSRQLVPTACQACLRGWRRNPSSLGCRPQLCTCWALSFHKEVQAGQGKRNNSRCERREQKLALYRKLRAPQGLTRPQPSTAPLCCLSLLWHMLFPHPRHRSPSSHHAPLKHHLK